MGFNIQPVVNEIIQSTQMTYFPLYSRSWAEVCATNPKGLSCSGVVFYATWPQHMSTASSDPPLNQDGWAQNALWGWAVAHNTKTLHEVSGVSMHQKAPEPRSLSLSWRAPALPPLSGPLAVCSLEATLLNGHFLLTGVVSKGETSVGVAVT